MFKPFIYAIPYKKAYTTLKALQKKISCSACYVPEQIPTTPIPVAQVCPGSVLILSNLFRHRYKNKNNEKPLLEKTVYIGTPPRSLFLNIIKRQTCFVKAISLYMNLFCPARCLICSISWLVMARPKLRKPPSLNPCFLAKTSISSTCSIVSSRPRV